jgi:hypothetical protein
MKFRIGQLKAAESTLVLLTKEALPITTAFKLARFLRAAATELSILEESRINLVRKYGSSTDPGKEVTVPEDKVPQFIDDYNELLSVECELEFEKIKLSEVPETFKITPEQALTLDPFIEL